MPLLTCINSGCNTCNGLFRFAVTPLRFDFFGLMRLCNTVTQINITPFALLSVWQCVCIFSGLCVYIRRMNNTELIITIVCLALGLLARPWRFKENRNSEGNLSFIAVFGWALILVGVLLSISAVNKGVGLSFGYNLGAVTSLIIMVWGMKKLYIFAQKYTYKQILITGWVTIGAISLLLSNYEGDNKKTFIQWFMVVGVIWILLVLFNRKK